jgi:hypothetical protein
MPMDSFQIAQLNSGFTGMYAGMRQYASQLGPGYGAQQSPMMAEGAMGMVANRAQAVGAPLFQGAMGMLGLDPVSLGLRGAMGAFGSGAGVLGAGAAGLGVAAASAIPMAAMGYAGSQVYAGMGQQQALNQTLRQKLLLPASRRAGVRQRPDGPNRWNDAGDDPPVRSRW